MLFVKRGVKLHTPSMIHLDTNFLIQATVAGSAAHAQFTTWASAHEAFNVSSIDFGLTCR
jgi:hypothetical protein